MRIGELPSSLEIGGVDYPIRTDYREALNIFAALADPELDNAEKLYVLLFNIIEDFEELPPEDYEEAVQQVSWFLDGGMYVSEEERERQALSPRLLDWEQDQHMIFSAVNKVAGKEVRSVEYMHWWTFLGLFKEIDEGLFTTVVEIRKKQSKGQKLEKHEREFVRENLSLVKINQRLHDRVQIYYYSPQTSVIRA